MNTTTSNLIDGKARRAAMVILPMLLLPISLAGVTVRPMLSYKEASAEAQSAEQQATRTSTLRRELQECGAADELEYRAALLERVLETLIPVELKSLEIYSVVRSAAAASKFELESLQVEEPTAFHDGTRGRSIGKREIRLRAKGSVEQAAEFIDRLRASGLPVAIQTFTFARRNGEIAYSADLLFDVFHHIPAVELTANDTDSMGSMESIPQ